MVSDAVLRYCNAVQCNVVTQPFPAEPGHIISILTTEHFALQSARGVTLSDAQTRATIFLTSVSSALVALAFVGQATRLAGPFLLFAGVLFATLYAMGLLTFLRIVQTAVEDTLHARGIARIRHYYLEVAPQLEPYFIHGRHDDLRGMIDDMGVAPNRYQTLLTSSAMINLIVSVLAAVVVGIGGAAVGIPLSLGVALAIVAFAVNVAFLQRRAEAMWHESERRFPARFASTKEPQGNTGGPA